MNHQLTRFFQKKRRLYDIELNYLNRLESWGACINFAFDNKPAGSNKFFRLMLICILYIALPSKASAQNITINAKNVSLETVLKDIESQSKYVFFYKKEDISGIKNITIELKAVPLKQALTSILKAQLLDFQIFDNTIAIKKQTVASLGRADIDTTKNKKYILRGFVHDESSKPIANAEVRELKLGSHTLTNEEGEFKLQSGSSGSLLVAAPGFTKKTVAYEDTSYINIKMVKGAMTTFDLSEVSIQSDLVKKNPTKFVNLENRSYMNLSQVLQGTIPGLSLKIVNTTSKVPVSIDYIFRDPVDGVTRPRRFTIQEFISFVGATEANRIIELLLSGVNIPENIARKYTLNTETSMVSNLVPEIRGANTFSSSSSTMLVVIDGFPQDGFPAAYPMNNVESIEVIKDAKELLKWGPRAVGGAIIIRTKTAKPGKIQFNFTTNNYFIPKPEFSRAKLKLANSSQYLSYLRDLNALTQNNYGNTQVNIPLAKLLLSQRRNLVITEDQFNSKWDSLSNIDNEDQIGMLMQNAFRQNNVLTASGGSKFYKFTLVGTQTTNSSNNLNSKSNAYGLNLNNAFNLLNDKLKIRWLINLTQSNGNSGYSFSPTSNVIEPYQLLVDDQGNYVYDNTSLAPNANRTIMNSGYRNHGLNLLEDATLNNNMSRSFNKSTTFNMDWNLLPEVKWLSSLFYTGYKNNNSISYGAESTYARQLGNQYGQLTGTGVNFYVPYGDIYTSNYAKSDQYNLRSSLLFSKTLGKHKVGITIGGGASTTFFGRPSYNTLYGYNANTETGTPIYLPTPTATSSISNFSSLIGSSSATAFPYNLTVATRGDTTRSRSLNNNIAIDYLFDERINLTARYSNVYSPLYGQERAFSTLTNYNAELGVKVVKNWNKIVKDVFFSAGGEGIKMPDLPAQYSNIRYQQSYLNNNAIWVSSAVPTQQSGQRTAKIFQKATVAFMDSTIVLNGAYNIQKMRGNLNVLSRNSVANNTDSTIRFFSSAIDLILRKGLFNLHAEYSKSPEGATQYNGTFSYKLSDEPFFKSGVINSLEFNALLRQISPFQGLSIIQGTNAATNGSYSLANNSDFTILPPKNTTFEAHALLGLYEDKFRLDLRYYDQTSSGLSNTLSTLTDPTTGQPSRITYSAITNKGVELFLSTKVIDHDRFGYTVTLNGAVNRNVARNVPFIRFSPSLSYTTAVREGNDISNIYAPRWAGLNASGDPQIYDKNGNVTATVDSAVLVDALVFQGVTKAPWTGGFIHEIRAGQFFSRVALTFNFGHVMRYYLPNTSSDLETSSLVADRWRSAGDEQFTDIPKISLNAMSGYREFISRYSSNSIISADNIRLQEVMIGYNFSDKFLKRLKLGPSVITFQIENVAYWARNKYHIDPATVGSNGRIGLALPTTYSCTLSMNF